MLREDRATYAGLVQQQNALRAYSVQKQAVERLEFPSIVLHGSEDRAVPLAYGRELADALRRATFVTLDGAGHNYLVSYPERANAEVLEFLADVDSRTNAATEVSGT